MTIGDQLLYSVAVGLTVTVGLALFKKWEGPKRSFSERMYDALLTNGIPSALMMFVLYLVFQR